MADYYGPSHDQTLSSPSGRASPRADQLCRSPRENTVDKTPDSDKVRLPAHLPPPIHPPPWDPARAQKDTDLLD